MSTHPNTEVAQLTLNQLTLDPENWDEFRQLGHRMLDDMLDHLSTLREQPAWQPLPRRRRCRSSPAHSLSAPRRWRRLPGIS